MFVDVHSANENVIYSRRAIQTIDSEKKLEKDERLLRLVCFPKLLHSFKVKGFQNYNHIACVPPNMCWVSDGIKVTLTNITGDTLYHLKSTFSLISWHTGIYHTVNNEGDLIYIDLSGSIKQLSLDKETISEIIEINYLEENQPRCVFCSPLNGDLLVGMVDKFHFDEEKKGKVYRYKKNWSLAQTSKFDKTGLKICDIPWTPNNIIENNNGDVVVSCYDFVVVHNSVGQPRFTYKGHPSGSELLPLGICTNALSHILIGDDKTDRIHIIDKDGQFLSHLLVKPSRLFKPHCLSYDVSSHCIYIGTNLKLGENSIYVYRHLAPETTPTGKSDL